MDLYEQFVRAEVACVQVFLQCHNLRTFAIHLENGMPSSRAKAKSCREEPAMTVTLPKNPNIKMRAVIALVAARDPVTL